MVIKVKYSGEDQKGRKLFKILGSKRYLKLVNGRFYYSTIYGEPDAPVRDSVKIVKLSCSNR